MGLFGVLFLFVALVLIGVGIALGCAACLALTVLLMLGIISSATSVGLYRKSASAGFRTFVFLVCGALGIPAGIVCALMLEADWFGSGGGVTLLAGGLAGLASGLVVAAFVCGVTRRLLVPRSPVKPLMDANDR